MSGLEQKTRQYDKALIEATFKIAFSESGIAIKQVLVGQYERDDKRCSDESYIVIFSPFVEGCDYQFWVDLSKRELTLSSGGITLSKDPSLEAKIFAAFELAAKALGVKKLKAVDVRFGDVDASNGPAKYTSINEQLTAARRIYWARQGFSLELKELNNLVGDPSSRGYLVKQL